MITSEAFRRVGIDTTGKKAPAVQREIAALGAVSKIAGIREVLIERTSGIQLASRVEASRLLRENDASRKDTAYQAIAQSGLALRDRYGQYNPNRFVSIGLLESIGSSLHVTHEFLSRALRVARIDVVLACTSGLSEYPSQELTNVFRDMADNFIEDYTTGKSPSLLAQELRADWDGETIPSFYKVIHRKERPAPTLGIIPPYEIGFLASYYNERISRGSKLSSLDRMLLEVQSRAVSNDRSVSVIKGLSGGLPHDRQGENAYTQMLLRGLPRVF